MFLWRISDFESLDGTGGKLYAGRWHTAGRPVVYLADSSASALLEMLVQLNTHADEIPNQYTLLGVSAPATIAATELNPVPHTSWKQQLKATQMLGDQWLAEGKTAIARVPSSIAPETWNYLLNPSHMDASKVQIAKVIRDRYDLRLLSSRR